VVVLTVLRTGFEVIGPTSLVTGFPSWIGVNRHPGSGNRRLVRANAWTILARFATSREEKQAAQNDG
jgi:hypothetical protein